MSTTTIEEPIYQGEGKWFKFTLVDDDALAIDLSAASFIFHIRESVDDVSPIFTASNWDIASAASGIVRANIPATFTTTLAEGTYYAQLMTTLTTSTDVDISQIIKFKVKKAYVKTT